MTSFLKNLGTNPAFLRWGARLALRFAPRVCFSNTAIFSRWADVQDILHRDLDFVIEPINKERIERVNGPFVLGLDRSARHLTEHHALYKALKISDPDRIDGLARSHARKFLADVPAGGTLDIVNGYARRIASRSATALTGIRGPDEESQMRVARAMFHELFLNLGGDKVVQDKALTASRELKQWCIDEIARRRKDGQKSDEDMIARLLMTQELDDDGIRRTVSGMFVGAIDTTTTCVAQIMAVISGRPALRREVLKDLDNPARMRGWCWEALRFWPHNPIVLRQASCDTQIGGTKIKAGTRVLCFTLAAMHDDGAFPQPDHADPQRPENLYLHFGGGLHPCAGRAINGTQIPALVSELLRRDPDIVEDIRFDGPFPDRFVLKLKK